MDIAVQRPAIAKHQNLDAIRILRERRRAFVKQTEGRKVHRVDLPAWPREPEPRNINIYDQARRLLAEAPAQWPDGASPFDVLETYTAAGTRSMYGIIGELCKWRVVETVSGKPSLYLTRWRPFSCLDRPPRTTKEVVEAPTMPEEV